MLTCVTTRVSSSISNPTADTNITTATVFSRRLYRRGGYRDVLSHFIYRGREENLQIKFLSLSLSSVQKSFPLKAPSGENVAHDENCDRCCPWWRLANDNMSANERIKGWINVKVRLFSRIVVHMCFSLSQSSPSFLSHPSSRLCCNLAKYNFFFIPHPF